MCRCRLSECGDLHHTESAKALAVHTLVSYSCFQNSRHGAAERRSRACEHAAANSSRRAMTLLSRTPLRLRRTPEACISLRARAPRHRPDRLTISLRRQRDRQVSAACTSACLGWMQLGTTVWPAGVCQPWGAAPRAPDKRRRKLRRVRRRGEVQRAEHKVAHERRVCAARPPLGRRQHWPHLPRAWTCPLVFCSGRTATLGTARLEGSHCSAQARAATCPGRVCLSGRDAPPTLS